MNTTELVIKSTTVFIIIFLSLIFRTSQINYTLTEAISKEFLLGLLLLFFQNPVKKLLIIVLVGLLLGIKLQSVTTSGNGLSVKEIDEILNSDICEIHYYQPTVTFMDQRKTLKTLVCKVQDQPGFQEEVKQFIGTKLLYNKPTDMDEKYYVEQIFKNWKYSITTKVLNEIMESSTFLSSDYCLDVTSIKYNPKQDLYLDVMSIIKYNAKQDFPQFREVNFPKTLRITVINHNGKPYLKAIPIFKLRNIPINPFNYRIKASENIKELYLIIKEYFHSGKVLLGSRPKTMLITILSYVGISSWIKKGICPDEDLTFYIQRSGVFNIFVKKIFIRIIQAPITLFLDNTLLGRLKSMVKKMPIDLASNAVLSFYNGFYLMYSNNIIPQTLSTPTLINFLLQIIYNKVASNKIMVGKTDVIYMELKLLCFLFILLEHITDSGLNSISSFIFESEPRLLGRWGPIFDATVTLYSDFVGRNILNIVSDIYLYILWRKLYGTQIFLAK